MYLCVYNDEVLIYYSQSDSVCRFMLSIPNATLAYTDILLTKFLLQTNRKTAHRESNGSIKSLTLSPHSLLPQVWVSEFDRTITVRERLVRRNKKPINRAHVCEWIYRPLQSSVTAPSHSYLHHALSSPSCRLHAQRNDHRKAVSVKDAPIIVVRGSHF